MCYGTNMRKAYIFFQVLISLSKVTLEHYRPIHTNFGICRYWGLDLHHNALKYLEMIYRAFPRTFPEILLKFDSGYNTEYIQIFLVFWDESCTATLCYSFFQCTRDGYSNWVQTITKFQMREVYTYIYTINLLLISRCNTGALRQSRPLLLAPDFSKLFSRRVSNEGRLADGLSTENCFFCNNTTHWHSPLFTLPGTWHGSTATRETKLIMLLIILHISYLNDIRDRDSRAGCSLTNSWWCNSFRTKPTLPCIFDHLPSWYNFLSARLQICKYGAIIYTNRSPKVKLRTVPNSICGSDSSVQHADPSLGVKVSLREQRMMQKILHTCNCPFTFSRLIATPLRDTVKMGCNSEGRFTTNAVNWKIW